ncbi:MAG: hypothetical protein AAF566_02115 [Pseudomonadota bacterium]
MSCRVTPFCAALLALLAFAPTSGRAAWGSVGIVEQIQTFATCAGRMMALRDHLALFGSSGVDRAESKREAHVSVLEALSELADGAAPDGQLVHQWRIEGRAAQGAVLSQSTFGTTQDARDRAARVSARHLSLCDRMILGT